MENTNIVQMSEVRSLLTQWEGIRRLIISGRISGYHLAVQEDGGKELIFAGGTYQTDHEAALRAVIKSSMAAAMQQARR